MGTWTLDRGEWSNSRLGRLAPGTEHRYPLSGRLCGFQSRSGGCVEDKKS
jgi:hypothetical protein